MYFNEHRWDDETGGALTFMIASVAFALPKYVLIGNRRCVSLALSVFFGAATVTTLIVDSAFLVVGLPLLYAALLPELSRDSLCGMSRSTSARSPQGHCCSSSGAASSRSGTTATNSCSSCRKDEPSLARTAVATSRLSATGCRGVRTSLSRPSSSCSRCSSCC